MYIRNLSYHAKEANLRQIMEECGAVDPVKLITDRETRKPKGFVFAEMPSNDEARNAIAELNSTEHEGRQTVIKEALPRN